MQITIERDSLSQALTAIANIAGKGDVAPILGHTLISANGQAIDLTGTDYSRWQSSKLPAEIGESGAACLPTATLVRAVKASPKGSTVKINADPRRAKVQCGRARYDLPILPAKDFPTERADKSDSCTFEMDAADLAKMLSAVKGSMSDHESTIYLNGVYLHVDDGQLAAASTNRQILSRFVADLPDGALGLPCGIVPANTVADLARWSAASEGAFEITMTERRISIAHADTQFSSALVEGTYPDYWRVIPETKGPHFEFEIDALSAAVDQVSAIVGRDVWAAKLVIEKSKAIISCRDKVTGASADATVPVDLHGKIAPMGISRSYLQQWLQVARDRDGAAGQMFQAQTGAPIRCVIEGDESYTCVIMPATIPG